LRKTLHFIQRSSQRGIRQDLALLAWHFGRAEGDRFVLGRKEILHLMGELDRQRRLLVKALDKGGLTVVADGETLVTVYSG